MIRVLLADDHALFRAGIRRILEEHEDLSVAAETGSGLEAVELAARLAPDVAVIDIGMKELNGVEAASRISNRSPETAVLMLSMHSDARYVNGAVRAGARGYLLKDSVEQGLIEAIHRVHEGQAFFSPPVAALVRTENASGPDPGSDPYDTLTERERQIFQLLGEGHGSKEIAARLGISVHTVETHRSRIMDKLGLHGIAELVLTAVRRGLVT